MICAACLLFATFIFWTKNKSCKVEWCDICQNIILSLFSGVTNQPMLETLSGRIPCHSEALGILWLLWHLCMIVFVNGYLGMVCALLTMGTKVSWPQILLELVHDNAYMIISTDVLGTVLDNGTISFSCALADTILAPVSKGPTPHEYIMLNKSYKFLNSKQFNIASNIVKENSANRIQERGDLQVGNGNYGKICLD